VSNDIDPSEANTAIEREEVNSGVSVMYQGSEWFRLLSYLHSVASNVPDVPSDIALAGATHPDVGWAGTTSKMHTAYPKFYKAKSNRERVCKRIVSTVRKSQAISLA